MNTVFLADCSKVDFSIETYEMEKMKEKVVNVQITTGKGEKLLEDEGGVFRVKKHEANRKELTFILNNALKASNMCDFILGNFGKMDEIDMQQVFQNASATSERTHEIMKIKNDVECLKIAKMELAKLQNKMDKVVNLVGGGVYRREYTEMRMCWEYIALRVDEQQKHENMIIKRKEMP